MWNESISPVKLGNVMLILRKRKSSFKVSIRNEKKQDAQQKEQGPPGAVDIILYIFHCKTIILDNWHVSEKVQVQIFGLATPKVQYYVKHETKTLVRSTTQESNKLTALFLFHAGFWVSRLVAAKTLPALCNFVNTFCWKLSSTVDINSPSPRLQQHVGCFGGSELSGVEGQQPPTRCTQVHTGAHSYTQVHTAIHRCTQQHTSAHSCTQQHTGAHSSTQQHTAAVQ